MKIYGIKNCSTVKKALTWLDSHDIPYQFHDFKKLRIEESKLHEWIQEIGAEALINKRGATWKTIPKDIQQAIATDEGVALKLMQDKTSVIKRPILETAKGIVLGFDEKKYREIFDIAI